MQSREDYNEFLAIHILNHEMCELEINKLSQKPEFTNFLSGVLAMMGKPRPFNINGNNYDPYLVKEDTIKNIRFILRVKRESLNEEVLQKLDAVELLLMEGYAKPLKIPKLPEVDSIYYGQPIVPVNPQTKQEPQNIYAFFEKDGESDKPENVISDHVANNHRRFVKHPAPFMTPITKTDVYNIACDISSQNFKVRTDWINAILNTPSCFTADVSQMEFAKTLDKSRRGVECAGFYAVFALIDHAYKTADMTLEENAPHLMKLHDLLYGMGNSDLYAVSGSAFKLGCFSKSPLTPEEIKAIPFAFGFWSDVSALIPHDDAKHIPALAEKLKAAGFTDESEFLEKSLSSVTSPDKPHKKANGSTPAP